MELTEKIKELHETIQTLRKDDEVIQPSINDRTAKKFVEEQLKVRNNRYKMVLQFRRKFQAYLTITILLPSALGHSKNICKKRPYLIFDKLW